MRYGWEAQSLGKVGNCPYSNLWRSRMKSRVDLEAARGGGWRCRRDRYSRSFARRAAASSRRSILVFFAAWVLMFSAFYHDAPSPGPAMRPGFGSAFPRRQRVANTASQTFRRKEKPLNSCNLRQCTWSPNGTR